MKKTNNSLPGLGASLAHRRRYAMHGSPAAPRRFMLRPQANKPRHPVDKPAARSAERRVTEGDACIAEALESAKIPPLVMSIIHMTGDISLLDRLRVKGITLLAMDGALSETDKAVVRAEALDALRQYREGAPMPPAPAKKFFAPARTASLFSEKRRLSFLPKSPELRVSATGRKDWPNGRPAPGHFARAYQGGWRPRTCLAQSARGWFCRR